VRENSEVIIIYPDIYNDNKYGNINNAIYIYVCVCGSNGLADKTSNVSKANLNTHPYFDGYQAGFFYYCFTNMTRDNFLGMFMGYCFINPVAVSYGFSMVYPLVMSK